VSYSEKGSTLTRARSYLHRTKIHGWRINCELAVIGARPRQTQHRDLARDSEMSETCETNGMLPFLAPMDYGAKMALKVRLSPLARVKVKSSLITANPVPRVVTCNSVSSESPALVIVTIPKFLWRTATFPKPEWRV
jgi:hypothetical protein